MLNQKELAQHLNKRLKSLENERQNGWDAHWRELAGLFLPRRSRFLNVGDETNKGGQRNHLEDGVGILALRVLSAGMQSGLTSPARPWFALSLQNSELSEIKAVNNWLHECYLRLSNIFARSNFYDQIHVLYKELGVFGTGVMLVEEDPDSVIRCRTLTAGEYSLATNANGRVDTLYRRLRMTARQVLEKWEETAPEQIRLLANNSEQKWVTLLHAIEPNPNWKRGSIVSTERQYRSVYMLLNSLEILEVGGYYEFPALCPRWDTTASDVYGESPGMEALNDCKQLQRLVLDGRLALEKEVNPPLLVAENANLEQVDVSPGALNYTSSLAQGQPSITSLYQVRSNLQALEQEKYQLRNQVKEFFFNDLFMMFSNIHRQMTATEVAERNAEKLLLLGPVLDRLRSELFQPLIRRCWGIAGRQGVFPPAPIDEVPELKGINLEELKIEFVSILALAQKQAGINAIRETVGFVGQVAQLTGTGEVFDNLNTDEAITEFSEMQGVPPRLIRSREEVENIRQERNEAIERQQQMQQAMAMAQMQKAGKDEQMAEAGMEENV